MILVKSISTHFRSQDRLILDVTKHPWSSCAIHHHVQKLRYFRVTVCSVDS